MASKGKPRRDIDTAAYKKARVAFLQGSPVCHWCKRAAATTIDHIIEVDRGADPMDETNWVAACHKCNARRGAEYLAKKRAANVEKRAKTKPFFDSRNTVPPTPSSEISPRGVNEAGDDGSSLNLPKAEAPGMIPPRLMSGLPSSSTYGPQVAKWAADHLNVELMPWQKLALDGQLTHDDEGNLTFRRSLISVARQNGKTVALTALIGWALTVEPVRRGQPVLVISTAHQLDLAVEIFERLAPILETKFGAKPYWSYGRNECVMPDGSRWLVQAATDRAFHGFSPTYIVADEIWNISPNVLFNGALPSQRAQQSPLMSCWSTAGTEDSKAMLRIREEALRAIDEHKITKLFMAEWSCPPGIDALANPGVWHMANPAIGYTLDPEVLVDEAEQSDKAAFMRASLNLWISASQAWLPPGLFAQLTVPDLPAGGVLAVDSSIDESLFCGVRAQLLGDGRIGVTVEFVADTIQACWDKVTEAAKTCQIIALTPSLHDMAPTALDRKKTCVGYSELLTHTGTIRQFIQEHRLVHTGEQMLAEHVDRAVGVKTSGGYVLSSQKSPGPITLARCMIFAAALIARPQQKSRAAIAFGPR